MRSSSSAVRPSSAQQETPPQHRSNWSWRSSVLPAWCPRDNDQFSHRSWTCCRGSLGWSPQTPLPSLVHKSTFSSSLRTFSHIMHLPIPNITSCKTPSVPLPACPAAGWMPARCSLSTGTGLPPGTGAARQLWLPPSCGVPPALGC